MKIESILIPLRQYCVAVDALYGGVNASSLGIAKSVDVS